MARGNRAGCSDYSAMILFFVFVLFYVQKLALDPLSPRCYRLVLHWLDSQTLELRSSCRSPPLPPAPQFFVPQGKRAPVCSSRDQLPLASGPRNSHNHREQDVYSSLQQEDPAACCLSLGTIFPSLGWTGFVRLKSSDHPTPGTLKNGKSVSLTMNLPSQQSRGGVVCSHLRVVCLFFRWFLPQGQMYCMTDPSFSSVTEIRAGESHEGLGGWWGCS